MNNVKSCSSQTKQNIICPSYTKKNQIITNICRLSNQINTRKTDKKYYKQDKYTEQKLSIVLIASEVEFKTCRVRSLRSIQAASLELVR